MEALAPTGTLTGYSVHNILREKPRMGAGPLANCGRGVSGSIPAHWKTTSVTRLSAPIVTAILSMWLAAQAGLMAIQPANLSLPLAIQPPILSMETLCTHAVQLAQRSSLA